METHNSAVAIIRFKPPFIQWANKYTPDGNMYSKEFFAEHSIAVIIPAYTFKSEAHGYINEIWKDIFREALKWWDANEYVWPRDRTRKMFGLWFDVVFAPTVIYSRGDKS
jgi:hypothetical protein